MPTRIQLRRAKGWRLPEGAVKVDRTTPWGNPFEVGRDGTAAECVQLHAQLLCGYACVASGPTIDEQKRYRAYVLEHIEELRGKDLACWCRPEAPCHVDTLLKLANR